MADEQPKFSKHHKFTSLYRYYGWSIILREQFQAPFREFFEKNDIKAGMAAWVGLGMGPGAAFMSYWYAALYVVIEGWQELGLTDPTIDALLASEHTKRLKIHRNATCHFQNAVWVEKWNHFEREPGAVDWVRSLDNAFGRYFLGQTKLYAEGVLKDDTVPAEAKQMTTQFLAMLRDRGAGDDPAA